jgi:hypothetical protein
MPAQLNKGVFKMETSPAIQTPDAKCFTIFENGVKTAREFAAGMSLLMGDVLSQRVSPQIANAVCNAGGKMLKAIEMEKRYGKGDGAGDKTLPLT